MTTRSDARIAARDILWVVVAGCWFIQAWLPWAQHGAVSQISPVEVAAYVRTGTLSAVSPWFAGVALVLPVLAGILLVLAPLRSSRAHTARRGVAVLGIVLLLASIWQVAGFLPGSWAPGAWAAMAGALVAIGLLVFTQLRSLPKETP